MKNNFFLTSAHRVADKSVIGKRFENLLNFENDNNLSIILQTSLGNSLSVLHDIGATLY